MTENMSTGTTAPSPLGATRPLVRDPDDDMFAGVCAALARYTDTDPVIWRIATVVLTIFGGSGIALYVLGWILIPKLGEDRSIADSWLRRGEGDGHMTAKTIALAVIALLIVVFGLSDGRGIAAAAVLAAVGYLVYRERQGRPLAPYSPVSGEPAPGAPAVPAWSAPPPLVRAPRERSRLGLATISATAVVTGILVWTSLEGAEGLTPGRITAISLMMIGAGLVVGTWFGRARWLVAIGLLLSVAVGGAFAADATGATLRGGVGERTWVVNEARTEQSFTLGVGEAILDLTQLPTDGPHIVVRSTVSLGHLVVLVPDDVPIRLHATLRIGEIDEFGTTLVDGNGRMERTRSYGPPGDPRVEVEASMGSGQIEVRHG
ncbi:MAG: PspC domain-containing protein [Frankiaceae bacterium]|nr:PspC domain-containing protein [Frankiaceae bacterium]